MTEDSAFPKITQIDLRSGRVDSTPGLTKREWFAGLAFQGLLAHGKPVSINGHQTSHDKAAVILADALIIELEKTRK